METRTLTAVPRADAGKGVARKLREQGMLPAVVYGPDLDAIPIAISLRDLAALFRKSESDNILIDLTIEGKTSEPYKVLIREVQRGPIQSKMLHVDFQQISLTKKITVSVPIHLKGIPDGVKTMGGILEFTRRQIDVACLPTDMRDFIEIDVSEMAIGDSVHARDLDLPGLELVTNESQVIVTVAAPTVAKVVETAAGLEAGEVAEGTEGEGAGEGEGEEKKEPEVITEKKKE
ncbi:MAG: 50S ribosomal protein L25 [Candidatus Zixiibacteriota bacterium]